MSKNKIQLSKKEALQKTARVDRMIKQMESSWYGLAALIQDCIDARVPAALGVTFTAWIEQRFGKRKLSDAWRKLRIMRALKGLPEKRVKALPESNAYALSRLPEKDRKDPRWLKAAETEKVDAFEEKVEKRLEQKTGIKREKFMHWFPTMPEGDKAILEAAETKLAHIFGMDLVQNPGLRIEIWRRAAIFFVTTEEEHLIIESEGGECLTPSDSPVVVVKTITQSAISEPSPVGLAASSGT